MQFYSHWRLHPYFNPDGTGQEQHEDCVSYPHGPYHIKPTKLTIHAIVFVKLQLRDK